LCAWYLICNANSIGLQAKINKMQVFRKGEYSGEVENVSSGQGIVASITTYQKTNFNGDLHFHENTHISFVLHGGCREKRHDAYERLPGKLTYYSAGEPHQVMTVADHSRHINIEIEPLFFREHSIAEGGLFAALAKNPDATFLMLQIYKELVASDEFSRPSIDLLLLDLVHQADKWMNPERNPSWVRLVKEQLHDQWDQRLSLQQLAACAGVHTVTISKYFSRYHSCTLGEYMRKLKVEKALYLIKSSDRSLTDIAYACGFADQSHFIRVFKEVTGFLPAAYQRL
jgi:AraC family transcriptional regulator